jgi:hypothetical protein
MLLPEE